MPEPSTLLWVLNGLFAILFALLGWWARTVWDAVQKLRADLNDLAIHIAQDYTPTKRFETAIDQVFGKLDRIIEMLAQKEDRK